jgi:hypothetical protein
MMNNSKLIPIEFIKETVDLTWGDCLWGYKRGYLTWRNVVDFAKTKIKESSLNILEADLSDVDKNNLYQLTDILELLAEEGGYTEESSRHKWLFLCLSFLYEKKLPVNIALQEVHDIYVSMDFDYPGCIEHFVDLIVINDPKQRREGETIQDFYNRLMASWSEWLVTNDYRKV